MIGADPTALDDAAAKLDAAADRIDHSADELTSSLGSVQWLGQVAVTFNDLWTGQHKPRLRTTAGFLRERADTLRRNANDQRAASSPDASAHLLPGGFDRPRLTEVAAALVGDLSRLSHASAAEQVQWWRSLTDDQRAALLATRPGELLALSGLPADVRATAQANYTSMIAGQIEVASTTHHVEAGVSIKYVKIGVEGDAEVSRFLDGHVDVTLRLAAGVGAGADGAAAMEKAAGAQTYTFDNQAQADAFLAGLQHSAGSPAGVALAIAISPMIAAGQVGASIASYLDGYRTHLSSEAVTLSGEGSADSGNLKVNVSQGVTVSRDTLGEGKGDITISASQTASAQAGISLLGVKGESEMTAAVTMHNNVPTTASFTMSFTGAALEGPMSSVAEFTQGQTASGTATFTFDLTNEATRSAAQSVADALARGDATGAAKALEAMSGQAQIVAQISTGNVGTGSVDAQVVSGAVTSSSSAAQITYVKPPGSDFYQVPT